MTSLARLLEMLAEASRSVSRDIQLRDQLIARLYKRGVSLRQIGEVAGLSHESVRSIVRTRDPKVRVD